MNTDNAGRSETPKNLKRFQRNISEFGPNCGVMPYLVSCQLNTLWCCVAYSCVMLTAVTLYHLEFLHVYK